MTKSFQIKVPGSTANLGPGFDSIGIGLQLYLTLDISPSSEWQFEHVGDNTPSDTSVENHLIYKIAKQIAEQYNKVLPPCKVTMRSELPLARGLGSSAAAIVAAIELVNQLCDLHLTTEEKLNLSSCIEGHPDNASASVIGGITISAMNGQATDTIVIRDIDVSFIVIIPPFELKTADARAVLPESYSRSYSVQASANANMLIAHLFTKNFERVGHYMENDLFHEPYRSSLIPSFYNIKDKVKALGGYGTALSGAGPTLISLVPEHTVESIVLELTNDFPDYKILATKMDTEGIKISESINTSI